MTSLQRLFVLGLGAALGPAFALASGCSSTGSGGDTSAGGTGGTQGGGCAGACALPGSTCTISPPPGSAAPSILCSCTSSRTWCCDGNCNASGGAGGVGGGAGGVGGSAGSSGTGNSCEGRCPAPGATCTIDPPPGSEAPSVLCNCTSALVWCCGGDTNCGTGGAGAAGGTGGAGGTGCGACTGGTGGTSSVNLDDLGTPCQAGQCPTGLTAVNYCGFAGCTNGTFCSCEIQCDTPSVCPAGSTCVNVADGPGNVCMKT